MLLFSPGVWIGKEKFSGEERNVPRGRLRTSGSFCWCTDWGTRVSALVREWKAHLTPGRVLQSYLCWVTAEVLEITGVTGRVNLRGREVSDVIKPHLEVRQPRGITAPGIVIASPWNCSSKRCVTWGRVWASPWSSQMRRPQRNPLRTGRRRQMSSGPQRGCWETKKTRTPSTDSIFMVQQDLNSTPSCWDTNPSGFKKKFKTLFQEPL